MDLEIPVSGIPITLVRTYDSLNANTTDELGYGWRLEFKDADVRVNLPRDPVFEELGYRTVGFRDETKVFVTLPGGTRETFFFDPTIIIWSLALPGNQGDLYYPAFRPDEGVTSELRVKDAFKTAIGFSNTDATNAIFLNPDGDYVNVQGQRYNPANPYFGGIYILTTKEGVEYEIDGQTGDILSTTDPSGNKLTFTDDGVFSSSGQNITFGRDAQGRITTVTDPLNQMIRYEYDNAGDLVAVTDREGNTTEYRYQEPSRPHFLTDIIDPLNRPVSRTEYDEKGRLIKIIDAEDGEVELIHDPDNFVETVKDELDNPTTYEYDLRGNVLTEIDPLGGITRMTYDENDNMLSVTDPDGVVHTHTYDSRENLLTVTDGAGSTTFMTYDAQNNLTNIVSPTGIKTTLAYNSRRNPISIIDADGLETTVEYNSQGRPTQQVAPDGQVIRFEYNASGNPTLMVDGRGNEFVANYDDNGRILEVSTVITPAAQTAGFALASHTPDPNTVSTKYAYDPNDRVTSVEDFHGNQVTNEYDAAGQLKVFTDKLGNQSFFRYDDRGLWIEATSPNNTPDNSDDDPRELRSYDAKGRVISETSPTGLITRYVYDPLDRQTEMIIPDLTPEDPDDNPKEITEYSLGGRILAEIDILGNRSERDYDDLGRTILAKDILDNVTTYTYNDENQVTSITDPRLRTTQLRYDENGRWIGLEFFDGTTISRTYDQLSRIQSDTDTLGQTTNYEYDSFSRLSAVINALGERRELGYDAWRNITRVKDPLDQFTYYEYDRFGRQITQIEDTGEQLHLDYDRFDRLTEITDFNERTTKFEYDNISQLAAVELPNLSRTEYSYDPLNRLVARKDGNEHVTQYDYDDFYRGVGITLPLDQHSTRNYNNVEQLISITDFNGDQIDYLYDQYGRLSGKRFSDSRVAPIDYTYDPVTSQLLTVEEGRGTMSFAYDVWDRLQTITQPDGEQLSYTYNDIDNVSSVTSRASSVNYTFDPLNRLDLVKQNGLTIADHDYDPAGNLNRIEMGNGVVETRQYDRRNRLTNIQTQDPTGQILAGFNYILDPVGNRLQMSEASSRVVDYTYDELDRLTQEINTDPDLGNRTIDYTYDKVGNRLTRNDSVEGLTTYTYDFNDRLTTTTTDSTSTQFDYDDNGNLIEETTGSDTVTYEWINDGENRLVGVNTGTTQQRYLYDDFGYRVARISDGVQTNYLQDLLRVLPQSVMEYDSTGEIAADYQLGYSLIRSIVEGNAAYHHTDALGSARLLTDPAAQVQQRYTYDGYGRLLTPAGISTQPIYLLDREEIKPQDWTTYGHVTTTRILGDLSLKICSQVFFQILYRNIAIFMQMPIRFDS
ncbi:MAG: RHS repeat protein [Synechococcaceae cyanobacterium SM2_3_1]|nr:RHS repeat protein [Synechococcaceae cyanobacterium SM2_3_1]